MAYGARVIGMSNGEPYDLGTFSGISSHLFRAMEMEGYLRAAISSLPSKAAHRRAQLMSFAPSVAAWRSRYRMSMELVRAFERKAAKQLRALGDDYDALFQFGAYCNVSAF